MQAGRYDQYIEIQRATRARNEYGEEAVTGWAPHIEAFAAVILPTTAGLDRAREAAISGGVRLERIVHFRVRGAIDVTGADRILWRDEPYGVEGVVYDPAADIVTLTGRYLEHTDGA